MDTTFTILTKEHCYRNGGSIENRKSVVEAWVYNFETGGVATTFPRSRT